MQFHDLHTDHNDSSVGRVVILWILCILIILTFTKCTPQQIKNFKQAAWGVADCSIHTAFGCSGQAASRCELMAANQPDWATYGECLGNHAGSCVSKGLALCGMAGIMKATGSIPVGGASGCDKETAGGEVRECIAKRGPQNRHEAITASSECWLAACGAPGPHSEP